MEFYLTVFAYHWDFTPKYQPKLVIYSEGCNEGNVKAPWQLEKADNLQESGHSHVFFSQWEIIYLSQHQNKYYNVVVVFLEHEANFVKLVGTASQDHQKIYFLKGHTRAGTNKVSEALFNLQKLLRG